MRDNSVDNIKGVATLLVLIGHAIQYSMLDYDSSSIFITIYSFHMPLFMFISGYLLRSASSLNVKKKSISLLLPFISWGGLIIVTTQGLHATWVDFTSMLLNPDTGLWFLWVLLMNFIFISLLRKTGFLVISSLILIALLYIVLFLYPELSLFGIGLFKWHFLFFIFGYVFRKRNLILYLDGKITVALVLVFLSTLLVWDRNAIEGILGLSFNSLQSTLVTLVVKYISAISGILITVFVFFKLTHFQSNLLAIFSKNSLGLYGAQMLVIISLSTYFTSEQVHDLSGVTYFLILITVSSSIVILFKKNNVLNRIFLAG